MKRILILFLLLNTSFLYSQQFEPTLLNEYKYGKSIFGDINNDGYLDIFSFGYEEGSASSSVSSFYIYNHSTSAYDTSAWIAVGELRSGSAVYGDFNNDNYLDIFLYGNDGSSNIAKLYHNNSGSSFTEKTGISSFTTGLQQAYVAVADFNNDGLQDIFIGSTSGIYIYENVNRGENFEPHTVSGSAISDACWAIADADGDGFIDIFVSGPTETYIYRNTRGFSFDKINIGFTNHVRYGSAAFGDINQDGHLDLILAGELESGTKTITYYEKNPSGLTYTIVNDIDTAITNPIIALVDADGDGKLDIAFSGEKPGSIFFTTVYRYYGSGIFEPWASTEFPDFAKGSLAWGDFNADGKIDLLATGLESAGIGKTMIFKNTGAPSNTSPTAPTDFNRTVSADSVVFTWTAGNDTETGQTALTYHIRIDTNSALQGSYLVSPTIDLTNNRKTLPQSGNVGNVLTWTLYKVPPGNYKPYIYTMDNSLQLSGFKDGTEFTVNYGSIPACSTICPPSNIKANSAILGAAITLSGADTADVWFVIWNNEGYYDSLGYSENPITGSKTCTQSVSGLSSETNYSYKAGVTNKFGSNVGDECMFNTLLPAPTFGALSFDPNPVQYDHNLTIYMEINNVNASDVVTLEYASYFQNGFDQETMNSSGNTWNATIDRNRVTENGLWFFIKVDQTSNGGSVYRYPENNMPYMVKIPLTQEKITAIKTSIGAFPDGLPPGAWSSYSLPYGTGTNKITLSQIFGAQKFNSDNMPTNWDAYSVNDGSFNRTNELIQSSAYFIFHRQNTGICPDDDLSYWGISPAVSDFYINSMPVVSGGWQLMPWPYLKTVSFTRKDDSGIYRCGKLWILVSGEWISEEDTRFNSTLKPYGAYAFHSKISNAKIDTFLYFSTSTMLKEGKSYGEGEWEIRLKAFDGIRHDRCNSFGASSHSAAGLDPNDEYEPPAMGDAVSAYFKARENDKEVKLSAEYQSVSQNGYAWDMTVENRGNRPVIELSWEKMNVPPGLQVFVVDLNHNEVIDLSSAEKYEFRAGKINPFKIYAGNSDFVNQEIENLNLPDQFNLHANYPNPFNPGTTIRYDLKLGSTVTLSVYNALGQKVRTLVNGKAQTTGSYNAYWDGKDALGRQVSSGVYIYRIDVKDINGKTFRKSNKMVLIK